MRVLVISNCATRAYTQGMQLLFPDWEIKGAQDKAAAKWVEEGDRKFLKFAANANIFVGTPFSTLETDYPCLADMPFRGKTKINIPRFLFRGLHPDSIKIKADVKSIYPAGRMHSRIVATSYLLGRSSDEAIAAFNADVYRRIGYFDAFVEEVERLCESFRTHDIDIREELNSWLASERFLYTMQHARVAVYFDILLAALTRRLIKASEREQKRPLRNQLEDYMEDGAIWPIYPELGAPHGISGELVWHRKAGDGRESLGLGKFVRHSYKFLAKARKLSPQMIPGFEAAEAALGGRVMAEA